MGSHKSRTNTSSHSWLNLNALRRMAGSRSFGRGEAYFSDGNVRSLTEDEASISAKVRGTALYRVRLSSEDGEAWYSCTCPFGQGGEFCKHCVAVGLAWLDQKEAGSVAHKKQSTKSAVGMKDVRTCLSTLDKDSLVDLLVSQAADNDKLRQRLFMMATRTSRKGLDVSAYRRQIDEAVETEGFVDYRQAGNYASGIDQTIDSIEELLKGGHPAEVIDLVEYALKAVEEAMGSIDDSDGYMGGILEHLQAVHLQACRVAKPDAEELAARLFLWEMRTDWDTFFGAAATYARILGSRGLTAYRKLAEAEWAKVPALRPGQDAEGKYMKYFRITHIMETLARQTGDVEAIVAIKQRDLSSAYAYLQIAETYKKAGKHDQALEWGERGVQAFPKDTDSRLREFLANEYHRRRRHDEAMTLVWAEFTESPQTDEYRNLKRHADKGGQWKAWRAKALDHLRQSIESTKRSAGKDRWARFRTADHTDLVRIFLWEKDIQAAWREANEGGCAEAIWMELAAQREPDFPEDALPIYQRQIEPLLGRKGNEAYREALGLLRKIRKLMVRLGREAEFAGYLQAIRTAHKPKRNFMKLLDREKW